MKNRYLIATGAAALIGLLSACSKSTANSAVSSASPDQFTQQVSLGANNPTDNTQPVSVANITATGSDTTSPVSF